MMGFQVGAGEATTTEQFHPLLRNLRARPWQAPPGPGPRAPHTDLRGPFSTNRRMRLQTRGAHSKAEPVGGLQLHAHTHTYTLAHACEQHPNVSPSTRERVCACTCAHAAWDRAGGGLSCPASLGSPVPRTRAWALTGAPHRLTPPSPEAGPGPSRPMLPGGGAERPPDTPRSSTPSQVPTDSENSPSFCQMPSSAPGFMPCLGLHVGPSVPLRYGADPHPGAVMGQSRDMNEVRGSAISSRDPPEELGKPGSRGLLGGGGPELVPGLTLKARPPARLCAQPASS